MVRLKLTARAKVYRNDRHFNPTMVRLKLKNAKISYISNNAFQSHNGSIKTILEGGLTAKPFNFNPTMVRLKR